MNPLWTVVNVEGKCILYVFYTFRHFCQMGRLTIKTDEFRKLIQLFKLFLKKLRFHFHILQICM